MPHQRSKVQQALVEELISSKAIDLERVAQMTGRFSVEAAMRGDSITFHVGRNFLINCGWPGPLIDQLDIRINPAVVGLDTNVNPAVNVEGLNQ